jgi:hypothetical protein
MGKQKMEKFDEMGKKCGKRIDDKKMWDVRVVGTFG